MGTLPQKPKPTAKQLAAVALLSGGPRTLNELEDKGISRAVLDNLCTKGVLECSKVNKSIDLYASIPLRNDPITLTEQQQAAYDTLLPKLEDTAPHSALLYGVTGSGKTLGVFKVDLPLSGTLPQGAGAGAGDQPDPADDPAAQESVWPPGGGAALCLNTPNAFCSGR